MPATITIVADGELETAVVEYVKAHYGITIGCEDLRWRGDGYEINISPEFLQTQLKKLHRVDDQRDRAVNR